MPLKRLIFTLLYFDGNFALSRNFRLQRVGDLRWLQNNYRFSQIAHAIDELVVLDVSRGPRDFAKFCSVLESISNHCFMPIAAGGGVADLEHAKLLLRSGADKVVLNTSLFLAPALVASIAQRFGQQCIIGSVDVKRNPDQSLACHIENGQTPRPVAASLDLEDIIALPIGELYLNSMDRDGTGQGYDLNLLDQLPLNVPKPVILAGGAGNVHHLAAGLQDPRVDAVASAHLFNFVNDGLMSARKGLLAADLPLARWDSFA